MHITKFERDAFQNSGSKLSSYEFVNVWPTNLASMRVAYGETNVLRLSVQLAYDRFFTKFHYDDSLTAVLNTGNDSGYLNTNTVTPKAKEKRPWWLNVYTLGGLL